MMIEFLFCVFSLIKVVILEMPIPLPSVSLTTPCVSLNAKISNFTLSGLLLFTLELITLEDEFGLLEGLLLLIATEVLALLLLVVVLLLDDVVFKLVPLLFDEGTALLLVVGLHAQKISEAHAIREANNNFFFITN